MKKISVNGSVTFGYSVNVKVYYSRSYRYASAKLDLKLSGDVSVSGSLDFVSIHLGTPTFQLMTGVYVKLPLSFQVEVAASLTFGFSVTTTVGAYYDSDQSGIHSLCSSPTASYKTDFVGTLYAGLKLDGYITIVDEKMSKIGLAGMAGFEVSMKKEIQTLSSSSTSKIHTCALCYAGTITIKATISASINLLNGKVDLTATLLDLSVKLYIFYHSADHDEWGTGTCPYTSYLCMVTVTDTTLAADPISGATISCHDLKEAAVTDESGVSTFYLPNGSYTLTVSSGEAQKTQSVTIKGEAKTVRVRLDIGTEEEGGSSSGSGSDTSEDEGGDTSEGEEGDGSDTGAETVASGTCGDDLTWVLDSNGQLTISGTGDMTSWSSYSSVPWYSYQSSITSVAIGSGVTSIGTYAFYDCTGLISVTIPDVKERHWIQFN